MNSVALTGRLGKDPELTYTKSGKAVCSFSIAVQHTKDDSSWVDLVCWEKTAEFLCQYFKCGDGVEVEGWLKQEKWQDQNGNNRSKIVINAAKLGFPISRSGQGEGQAESSQQRQGSQQQSAQQQRSVAPSGRPGGSAPVARPGSRPQQQREELDPDAIPF